MIVLDTSVLSLAFRRRRDNKPEPREVVHLRELIEQGTMEHFEYFVSLLPELDTPTDPLAPEGEDSLLALARRKGRQEMIRILEDARKERGE